MAEAISQADQAAANRLRQTDTIAKDRIGQSDKMIKDAQNGISVQREEAARQVFDVINQVRALIDETGQELFRHVNETLAASAAILDAVPLVDVRDTVFSIASYRLRADAPLREVSIFGYFPSIAADAKAVTASVNGKVVQVRRGVGKIFFDLPSDIITPQSKVLNIEILLPRLHWYSISRQTPVVAKLLIGHCGRSRGAPMSVALLLTGASLPSSSSTSWFSISTRSIAVGL